MKKVRYSLMGVKRKGRRGYSSYYFRNEETGEKEYEYKECSRDESGRHICLFLKEKEKQGIQPDFGIWGVPKNSFEHYGIEPPVWYDDEDVDYHNVIDTDSLGI